MSNIDKVISQLERQETAIRKALAALREIGAPDPPAVAKPTDARSQPVVATTAVKRRVSVEGRRRMAEAARKRWVDKRAAEAANKPDAPAKTTPLKKKRAAKRFVSAESKKRMSEGQKKRWARKPA